MARFAHATLFVNDCSLVVELHDDYYLRVAPHPASVYTYSIM